MSSLRQLGSDRYLTPNTGYLRIKFNSGNKLKTNFHKICIKIKVKYYRSLIPHPEILKERGSYVEAKSRGLACVAHRTHELRGTEVEAMACSSGGLWGEAPL